MPWVSHRWLGGMLTNFKTIKQSIRRLAEIDEMQANGTLDQRSKREAQMVRRDARSSTAASAASARWTACRTCCS
jgi:small subunit ribosomal protein S2